VEESVCEGCPFMHFSQLTIRPAEYLSDILNGKKYRNDLNISDSQLREMHKWTSFTNTFFHLTHIHT
jgi:hypothetical protein